MPIARTFAHWLICSAALAFFAVSATAFCAVVLAAVAADRIWPNAALHIESLPRRGVKLSQFVPTKRKQPRVCPAVVGYYAGEVRSVESPHDAATQEQ